MARYVARRDPIVFEARQVTAENLTDVAAWCGGDEARPIGIHLRPGDNKAAIGDWIAEISTADRGSGGFYAFTDADFRERFWSVEERDAEPAPDPELERLCRIEIAARAAVFAYHKTNDAVTPLITLAQALDGTEPAPDPELERLRRIERAAQDASRGNSSETDEYERGWLAACTEILDGA